MRPIRVAVVASLLLPATAVAQQPTTPTPVPPAPAPPAPPAPTPPPVPTPPPPAPVPPAAGKLMLKADQAVLTGQRIRVEGRLSPAVRGETVTVSFRRGRHTLRMAHVRAGTRGRFVVGYAPHAGGSVTVHAVHSASAAVARTDARPRRVEVIVAHAAPGSHGASVRWLQQRLAALHYVTSRGGTFDAATGRAVLAYRKMTGMARTESATRGVFSRLMRRQGTFKVRYPSHGRHVEADLSHQVLALIDRGGRVARLYHMSSGKPSTPTVLGHYRVYSKTPGTNSEGMVDSNYFIRGYAIHGYFEVPTYAASHGCLRVPIPNAASIYGWVRMGTPVDVYYR